MEISLARMYATVNKKSLRTQSGATSIEFAFFFVLLFFLFYGLVGYSMPLLLTATYQEVAADALREAIRHQDLQLGDPILLQASQQVRVRQVIADSWLPADWFASCRGYPDGPLQVTGDLWSVCLRHDNPRSILPPLSLLGWEVPQLPEEIRGEASIRIR